MKCALVRPRRLEISKAKYSLVAPQAEDKPAML